MDLSTQRLMMGAAGSAAPAYVEDVFSTWLYTGNGSTQTITNGIDLSGKGGLVWLKDRVNSNRHGFTDTARGATYLISSNLTNAESQFVNTLTSFSSTGFSIGSDSLFNASAGSYASWTFRKAAKFFDVVTFTQPGAASGLLTVSHSLGSTPGCIIVKRTSSTSNWPTYHRSIPSDTVNLNLTSAASVGFAVCQNVSSTSFDFDLTSFGGASGSTYVAYLFAHDAGGFGDSGSANVVSCGSFTTNGSGVGTAVSLGWEPQWIMYKSTVGSSAWKIADAMRGIPTGGNDPLLSANSANAENTTNNEIDINATGFQLVGNGNLSDTYIYIAIRRGPMKTPTDATKVYTALSASITSNPQDFTTNFPVDHVWTRGQNTADGLPGFVSRLTNTRLSPDSTAAEAATSFIQYDFNDRVRSSYFNAGFGTIQCMSAFRRAPGFFDVVAYTGTGVARTINHNLGVVPELGIFKIRSTTGFWLVYSQALGNNDSIVLQSDSPASGPTSRWDNTSPTNQVFTLGAGGPNASGHTYVGYLFATCPGVSKVGSYTGTGTTLQVNCGFTSGARFVLIKRTDSTGDWYVWDSARGIVAGNDPYLLLNSTAAEVTGTDYVDTFSSGFEISSTAPAAINANGGSFIFLAVA